MIKTILWDFDGVILDSMKIKGDGFVELFKSYPHDKIKQLKTYHYANGGVSRFDKIRYFFNELLQKDILDDEVETLAQKFGHIIEKKLYDKDNLIHDSLKFIKENYQNYNFHIVSGAEHNELNDLCKHFNIEQYFITIMGSPIKKDVLIKTVLDRFDYQKDETVLIGDAITDYNAALKNGIQFLGYNNNELSKYGKYIDSLQGYKL